MKAEIIKLKKKNKFPNIEDKVKIGTSNCSRIEDTALHSVST